nr:hypothetical protein [Tanacetum cinerariifolium]
MLLKKLPEKLRDPDKFLISCDFPRIDVCHALADLDASINLIPLSIWKKLSLSKLTPTRMILELADRSITHPKGVAEDVFVKVEKFHFPTNFVVVDFKADPRVPLILGRSFLRTGRALIDVYGKEITLRVNDEAVTFNLNQTTRYSSTYNDLSVNRIDIIDVAREECSGNSWRSNQGKSLIEEPPELELKDLPSHLEYDYLECVDKLPVIIVKDLKVDEKDALLKVLKSHKRAIAWKIIDIKGIDPRFCTHKILMDEDYNLAVQSQRRVNPKIHKVIKKQVIKLLDAGMIYPIYDSPWVSSIHCVPKKGGITVVENENNELIPTRVVTGWRVCIDYRKLNDATSKDNFPLLLWIRYTMLQRCEDTNFVLNWEKCHFMVKEGIFLGHKISKNGLEVDHAKVDVIAKLPHPTTVKGVRSFLVHADCIDAFETLKKKLTEAPILVVPDWNLPFKLMCDASDFAIGVVLGQRKTKHFQPIHYTSKTMTEAQIHYTRTEKKMLAVVYAFEKFRPYLVLSKSIVYTDHSTLTYLLSKQDAKLDHLSRLENPHKDVFENKDINENFPLETLGKISSRSTPWFADFANFHAGIFIVKGMSSQQKKKFFKDLMISSKLVMKDPSGAIMVPISPLRKAIISYRGTYFCNDKLAKVMSKYGVTHHLATAYHLQTSGQVDVSNRGLKRILERTVGENRALWFEKLDDALWAFITAYKTSIGCTPYKLVYRKSCHLLIELEHKAYWALKHVNFDLKTVGDYQKLQLNELRDQDYKNSLIYKEKTKKLHDSEIKTRIFNVGDRVLLFNSRLKIFSGKLKTRWSGPFTITKVFHMEPLSYLNRMVQTLR